MTANRGELETETTPFALFPGITVVFHFSYFLVRMAHIAYLAHEIQSVTLSPSAVGRKDQNFG
jgi:hypothetical protein